MSQPKNYYEAICYKYISSQISDEDIVFDAMCVALNNLAPKYGRDDACMEKNYMHAHIEDMNILAEEACKIAINFVIKHKRKPCR